jgi:hypothetical protein
MPDVDNPAAVSTTCGANVVDVPLEAFVLVNNAKRVSYWKHQFDRHTKNRHKNDHHGDDDDDDDDDDDERRRAKESEADLLSWIRSVKDRYTDRYYQTLFADEVDGLGDDLSEWHELLSAKVDKPKKQKKSKHSKHSANDYKTEKARAKAEAEIATLVMNVMSLKIGQTEIVSQDGHDVSDVITYASQIVIDPENTLPQLSEKKAYELAEKIVRTVNKQKTIKSGDLPDCSEGLFDCERVYKGAAIIPDEFSLDQNYPNPFAAQTTIRFGLPEAMHVTIEVYDMLGKHVRTLTDAEQTAGFHDVAFVNTGLASGLYFYRIKAGNFMQVRKMLLTK